MRCLGPIGRWHSCFLVGKETFDLHLQEPTLPIETYSKWQATRVAKAAIRHTGYNLQQTDIDTVRGPA